MTDHEEKTLPPDGRTPLGTALRDAVEAVEHALRRPGHPGDDAAVLDALTLVHRHVDALQHRTLTALARVHANGNLLDIGGQRTMAAWMTHAYGIPARRAKDMELLAEQLHHRRLPETARSLADGELTLGEAIAIAKQADKAAAAHAELLRYDPGADDTTTRNDVCATVETAILRAKADSGVISVARIHRLGSRILASLTPDHLENDHAWAQAGRGARLTTRDAGTFHFEAWGPVADASRLLACLDSYTPPPSADAAVPCDTKAERTYEAFATAMGVAHSHHTCAGIETPVVHLDVLVPDTVLAGNTTAGAAVTDTGRVLPVSVLREWLTRSTIRPLFVNEDGVVAHVGERRRLASSALRAAAFKGHSGCAWKEGCDRPLRSCQADHIVEFFQGGPTRADNLQPLCSMHNRLKHRRALARDRHKYWSGRTSPAHRNTRGPEPVPPADAPQRSEDAFS